MAWVVQFLIRGPAQGWTVEPDGLRPKPYTNRVKSQGFMGGVMRNPASSCPLKGRVCPPHPHTPTLHTKRHTKENFLKNRIVASTPHIVHRQPPMTPWRDGWTMGWVGAWTVGTVTGWGRRVDRENNLLDNLHEKGYYPPSNEEQGRKRRLWREGRTSDKRSLMGTGERRKVWRGRHEGSRP